MRIGRAREVRPHLDSERTAHRWAWLVEDGECASSSPMRRHGALLRQMKPIGVPRVRVDASHACDLCRVCDRKAPDAHCAVTSIFMHAVDRSFDHWRSACIHAGEESAAI